TYSDSFVQAPVILTSAKGDTDYTRQDIIYDQLDSYYENNNVDISTFPFAFVSSEKLSNKITYETNNYTLTAKINNEQTEQLIVPDLGGKYVGAAQFSLYGSGFLISFDQPYMLAVDGVTISNKVINDLTATLDTTYREAI